MLHTPGRRSSQSRVLLACALTLLRRPNQQGQKRASSMRPVERMRVCACVRVLCAAVPTSSRRLQNRHHTKGLCKEGGGVLSLFPFLLETKGLGWLPTRWPLLAACY